MAHRTQHARLTRAGAAHGETSAATVYNPEYTPPTAPRQLRLRLVHPTRSARRADVHALREVHI